MREEQYWFHKLEKIQYALWAIREVVKSCDIQKMLELLEEQERKATEDLIQAENLNAENWDE